MAGSEMKRFGATVMNRPVKSEVPPVRWLVVWLVGYVTFWLGWKTPI